MSISLERKTELEQLCNHIRREMITLMHRIQTGHPGGSLSAVEILCTLYFEKMNVDKAGWTESRDRFILSKGHAAPALYLVLAEKGFIPKEQLSTLRQIDSCLQGHPCTEKTPGIELSTGPLGLGLSAGIGMALSARLRQQNYTTYVLLGDGEIQEGMVWEAAMSASKFKVDNLIAILDYNGVQLDGTTDEIMPLGDVSSKWEAFGWNVINIDGHCISSISDAVDKARNTKGKPTIIIARTTKGKGISFMEGQNAWHGKPIGDQEYAQAMKELGEKDGR